MNSKMKFIAIFGSTKEDTSENYQMLETFLNAIKKPFVIVTSTCKGWDAMARRYAGKTRNVFKLVIQADLSSNHQKGIEECNKRIESICDIGITGKKITTPFTRDMVERLEKNNKDIFYL